MLRITKIHSENRTFKVGEFCDKSIFLMGEAQNAVNPIWIYEYFNEASAENTCFKI